MDGPTVVGRGEARPDDGAARARFLIQRPGRNEPAEALMSPRLSRVQLRVRPVADGIEVESAGRSPLFWNGQAVASAHAKAGDTLVVGRELLLVVVRRARSIPALRVGGSEHAFAVGAPDRHGIVGESAAVWRLRDAMAFVARSNEHVLIFGSSGTGKELAARAIHAMSARSSRKLVSRNAATLPESLADAELFGQTKDYPNPGAPERPGLVGEADGSTLFLDEIGEISPSLQAHLLRVLDRGGEYQRLGESRVRTADLRVVAATNRKLEELKHDLAARLTIRLEVPSLAARREDVPLIAIHLLRLFAADHPDVAKQFFSNGDADKGEARIDPLLLEALVRHPLPLETRDLRRLLWQAVADSRGDQVEIGEEVRRGLDASGSATSSPDRPAAEAPPEPSEREIEGALARHRGNVTRAAAELGLKNRFALYRRMRKLGMSGAPADDEPNTD
ncbi:MAG: sigma-54-dependent Fis family transcriptional regulator [Polyangiaceae bacterium]|nr:sigma-54-dependent Fis family transcriptional regulator [Polyangiaceae bacterium]